MIAILSKKNSYVAREYAFRLLKNGVIFCLIQIGRKTRNTREIARSGKNWKPITIKNLKKLGLEIYDFDKFDLNFKKLIKKKKIKLGIQAGVGILKKNIIKCFKKGIINCHPGDIPFYRGASSPEYQIIDKKPVKASFHFIDDKIDAGYLICKKKLKLNYKNYYFMRSTIYPEMAKILAYLIPNLETFKTKKVNLKNSKVRSYIGRKKISLLKKNWNQYCLNF